MSRSEDFLDSPKRESERNWKEKDLIKIKTATVSTPVKQGVN